MRKTVFTNGCFDLVHPGHIALFQECADLAPVLHVGLNDDSSIRRLKDRDPICCFEEREDWIRSICCWFQALHWGWSEAEVHVHRMDGDTPLPLIQWLKPDFLVKCCLTFWYLLGEDDEWPLAAEFSFDYDLPEEDRDHGNRLERFSPEVVAGTNLLFRSLQKQVGWVDRSGTTKTAYAFDAL